MVPRCAVCRYEVCESLRTAPVGTFAPLHRRTVVRTLAPSHGRTLAPQEYLVCVLCESGLGVAANVFPFATHEESVAGQPAQHPGG